MKVDRWFRSWVVRVRAYLLDQSFALAALAKKLRRTDAAVAGKADASHTHVEADITDLAHTTDAAALTSGVLADARVQQSNVTQHEGAIDHDALTNFLASEHIPLSTAESQASHGFSVGDPVYIDNTSTWNLAKADAIGTLAMGIVTAVNGNNFTVQFGGVLAGLGSLSAGTIYYLSAATAGALTTTPPSTATQFVQLVIHTTSAARVLRLGQGDKVP